MTNEDIKQALSRRKRIVYTSDLVHLLAGLISLAIIGIFVIIDLFIWITLEFKGFDMIYALVPQAIFSFIAALIFAINHTIYYIKHARELTLKDKLKLIWIDTKIGAKENFGSLILIGFIILFIILPLAIIIYIDDIHSIISNIAFIIFLISLGGLQIAYENFTKNNRL